MGNIAITSVAFTSNRGPTGRFGGVPMLVRGSPRVRGDMGAALYFFLGGGICSFSRLLVGGFRLQDGRQRL